MIDQPLLQTSLAAWGLACDDQRLARWSQYAALLVEWNERMNLVAQSTLPDLTRRHLLDSLVLATAWEREQPPAQLIDIGSGAGLPGVPLAILWPDTRVVLVESIGKKTSFLQHVAAHLPLPNLQIETARAEDLGQHRQHRERYELVTARAVANLATLAEYCLPLCRLDGLWLAPKGADSAAEVQDAEVAITTLGGALEGVYDVFVPDSPERSLVVVQKIRPTPAAFPRAVGIPAKHPL